MTPDVPQCRGLMLTCIDFRFVESLHRWLEERGLAGDADVVAWPGGALRLADEPDPAVLDTLGLAQRLHSPEELILTVHHDCGWLGGSSQFDSPDEEVSFLDQALEAAAAGAARHLPGLTISQVRLDFESPERG